MKVEFPQNSHPPHVWISASWCAFAALIFGAIAVISCWIRKCSFYQSPPRSVSILVYKTINSVYKSSRKIIVRVCEVANAKKVVKPFKMFNLYSTMNRRHNGDEKDQPKPLETTGHDRFCQIRHSRSSFRKKRKKHVRRAQSANEFDSHALTAANKRTLFKGRSASSEQENSESEQTEKSPLVSAKLETFAKILFNRTINTSQDSSGSGSVPKDITSSPSRNNLKYQYSALDGGMSSAERTPRERVNRERAFTACQEWCDKSDGRYEIIAHLDDIGCRPFKNWFLLSDTSIRTDRLMTLVQLPPDCVALEELPPSESPNAVIMELLGSLQHPYVYPVLDMGFFFSNQTQYACLVMPFNARGSLKDLIYKSQWNEPWNRKYTRKSTCLPLSQVQRLGRQILEALLFLRERGFPSHGHLHSGNVILQNGVARLSGLENGLLGLNSKVNAVVWSRSLTDVENMDIICFGHLLFEMCTGYELTSPKPTAAHLRLDLERYPQVVEVLQLIFESPDNRYPTVEELVLCDLFRNIDLRELRGPTVSQSFKHGLSISTLNLLNAVRRRQGASLNGSYSEGSSPCTPPSTPHRRNIGYGLHDLNSFDFSTDSEDILDEIVITPSTFDLHAYSFLHPSTSSPIHFCDNSNHSDDNSMPSTSAIVVAQTSSYTHSADEMIESIGPASVPATVIQSTTMTFSNQLTANSCNTLKNSKSRRMEYSMRSMKMCSSSGGGGTSQDSAFGSMTDELSITSSSLRMSSFQSISSPINTIDEGVEDPTSGISGPSLTSSLSQASTASNNESTDANDFNHFGHSSSSASDFNLSKKKSFGTSSTEIPTILVNDTTSNFNQFYTTSPAKAFGTIEVFSQKYRVSSFEDMSSKRAFLKNVHKQNFRSLEEEKRIDSAFMPISKSAQLHHHRSFDANRSDSINNSEKFKKLTHVAFASKISTTRERHTVWKNSILARKNNLIKSNESLHDYNSGYGYGGSYSGHQQGYFRETKLHKRVSSTNELCSSNRFEAENRQSTSFGEGLKHYPRKSRSERYLLNLVKLKQTTITSDCEECDEDEVNPIDRSEMESFIDETSSSSSGGAMNASGNGGSTSTITNTTISYHTKTESNSTDSSPSHRSMCKIMGGIESDTRRQTEEKIPLLDGMEMETISPTEPDEML